MSVAHSFTQARGRCYNTPCSTKEVATDEARLRDLLESFQQGAMSVEETLERLRHLPYEDIGFAEVDHHRALRRGFPEVVLGEGKSSDQVVSIAERLGAQAARPAGITPRRAPSRWTVAVARAGRAWSSCVLAPRICRWRRRRR